MLRVHLQDALGLRRVLPRRAEHALDVRLEPSLRHDQAHRRIREPMRYPHLAHVILQLAADVLAQILQPGVRLGGFLLRFLRLRELQIGAGGADELRPVEIVQALDRERVDGVRHEEHLVAALAQRLGVGALLRERARLRDHVVDGLLPLHHARLVVSQGREALPAAALVAEQRREARLLLGLEVEPLLQDVAERLPEAVVLGGVLRSLVEEIQHLLDDLLADHAHDRRILEELARDVERQILRIDDAAHEPEPARQELLALLHDEDALHVESQAVLHVGREEIEGRALRDEQEPREELRPLHLEVLVGERRVEIVREVLVELGVLLLRHLRGPALPQGLALV